MYVKRAEVPDAAARFVTDRVAGDAAVPEGQGSVVVDSAALLALGMGDLACRPAVVTVGNVQRRTAVDLDDVFAGSAGNSLAVEAEVDIVGARPGIIKSDVG